VTVVDTGTDQMLAHVADGIGWVVYNNPDRHNAMTYDMQAAVPRILDALATDPEVRVVVVRGAGEKAFVSGADISEFADKRTADDARAAYDEVLNAAWTRGDRSTSR
jgi:enoyl-CoA hydratase/carnithine racemase